MLVIQLGSSTLVLRSVVHDWSQVEARCGQLIFPAPLVDILLGQINIPCVHMRMLRPGVLKNRTSC